MLVLPAREVFGTDDASPVLMDYVFDWRAIREAHVGLALGYGSLYNHRIFANATWTRVAPDLLDIHAHRDIAAGEEITINYHGTPGDPEPAAFEQRGSPD